MVSNTKHSEEMRKAFHQEPSAVVPAILFSAIVCPVWHHTVLRVVPGGVEIKCKSCRGAVQHITREELEREWTRLTDNQAS